MILVSLIFDFKLADCIQMLIGNILLLCDRLLGHQLTILSADKGK